MVNTRAVLLHFVDLVPFAVAGEDDVLAFEDRFEVDGAPPEGIEVAEGLLGVLDVELAAVEAVAEVELAVAVVVAVLDHDVREAEVGHALDQAVADLAPI